MLLPPASGGAVLKVPSQDKVFYPKEDFSAPEGKDIETPGMYTFLEPMALGFTGNF